VRAADGTLRRLEDADHAVAAGRDLAIDGSGAPASAIGGTSEEHAKAPDIVRAFHVGDGVRAHAMADSGHLAAGLAETPGGMYPRLLEGRQAAVIARCPAADLNDAPGPHAGHRSRVAGRPGRRVTARPCQPTWEVTAMVRLRIPGTVRYGPGPRLDERLLLRGSM
jgi:hypothetical protein